MPDFTPNMNALMNGHLNLPDKDKEEAGADADTKGGGSAKSADPADVIPKPNYDDQKSRNQYLAKWAAKHGNLEGRGDHVLRVNEVPRGGSSSMKTIATNAAKKYGLDPALLYASAMEEGASALFKNKDGTDTKGRKPDNPNYMDMGWNKDFSVKNETFGLNTFNERFPDLVKGGYLKKDFQDNFNWEGFKSTESAMQAKAAMMKYTYDDVEKFAKTKGIDLSPKARDFFALAEYNSGEGGFKKLLKEYQAKGLLDDDKFLKENPHKGEKIPENQDIYKHVTRRMKMRDDFRTEKLFGQ